MPRLSHLNKKTTRGQQGALLQYLPKLSTRLMVIQKHLQLKYHSTHIEYELESGSMEMTKAWALSSTRCYWFLSILHALTLICSNKSLCTNNPIKLTQSSLVLKSLGRAHQAYNSERSSLFPLSPAVVPAMVLRCATPHTL